MIFKQGHIKTRLDERKRIDIWEGFLPREPIKKVTNMISWKDLHQDPEFQRLRKKIALGIL